ncbi:hypothetical protein KP509_06G010900 [Ceratopteris richardii]|nr:hypothetical protein KP509_06G010900 [Ceratopteris richardii]
MDALLESSTSSDHVDEMLNLIAGLEDTLSLEALDDVMKLVTSCEDFMNHSKRYQRRIRVQVLFGLAAIQHSAKHGRSRFRDVLKQLKMKLRKKMLLNSGLTRKNTFTVKRDASVGGNDGDVKNNDNLNGNGVRYCSLVRPSNSMRLPRHAMRILFQLHKKLIQIDKHIFYACKAFETLMPLIRCSHEKHVNTQLIFTLRGDPLWLDGVAADIKNRNARLMDDLRDVREQVLYTFCVLEKATACVSV